MRISDWSSDVCSSDLRGQFRVGDPGRRRPQFPEMNGERTIDRGQPGKLFEEGLQPLGDRAGHHRLRDLLRFVHVAVHRQDEGPIAPCRSVLLAQQRIEYRSEEHTSELQSLMRISYAVFCLKKNG